MPVSPSATHDTENRVRACSSPARRPSELAISTRRVEEPNPACTWEIPAPEARAASSARWSSSRASALEPVLRSGLSPRGEVVEPCNDPIATVRVPPPPLRATAEAASAARNRPSTVKSAVWAKPVVSPDTTRIPAPRSRPEASSSTRPSSSMADEFDLSSANTSAKSPPLRSASASTCSNTRVSITTAS